MSTATATYENMQAQDLLDDDLRIDQGMETSAGPGPLNFPTRSRPTTPSDLQTAREIPPASRSRALSRLLAMADSYMKAGSLRQALEMYFGMIQGHPDAPEALEAEERVLEVARRHEEAGELHSARAIYEQML